MLQELGQAANAVTEALNNLLKKVKEGSKVPGGKYDDTCDDILGATDRLFNSMGNAGEMVKQAKVLAQVGDFCSSIYGAGMLSKEISLAIGTGGEPLRTFLFQAAFDHFERMFIHAPSCIF